MKTTTPSPSLGERPSAAAPRPSAWAGSWYFPVTVLSLGLLAWVPFLDAARRLRTRKARALAVGYAVAAGVLAVLLSTTPADTADMTAADNAIGVVADVLIPCLIISALLAQISLRSLVYAPRRVGPSARRTSSPLNPLNGRRLP